MRPVAGYFCTACKKLISPRQDYEIHCKTKEHYDKFVDVVNGKKTKAFKMAVAKDNKSSSKTSQDISKPSKRKSSDDDEEEEEEEEDDSGNWKRNRKNEYPVAYDF